MNYIITTQITESYYEKTKPLFHSIKKYWKGKFIVGFVDFTPTDFDGDYYHMKRENIGTYRTNYPTNRKDFVCPQSGEFIDYLECDDDDVIIQIDADTVMQREITEDELKLLTPDENEFISVYGAVPPNTLYKVAQNLKFVNPENYKHLEHLPEFTPSFIVGNKESFTKLRDKILLEWDEFIKINSHHAGIQWITSKIGYEHFKIKILSNKYQCGSWYGMPNMRLIDNLLHVNYEMVIFNHNKYIF